MNKDDKFVHVDNEDGDWEGYYLNGKLLGQGHSVRANELLEALGFDVENIELTTEEIEELGCQLPKDIKEVREVHDEG